ncbi:MAG: efflux RND transporter periplasmic adaptor subunit [Gammaproteobacteria bacterium]|nr:efflux RND transporter periplasmic adaptor subunit [Gammaproteobacteria bacterium]
MRIRQTVSDRPWILAVVVTALVAAWLLSGMIGREGPGSPLQFADDVGVAADRSSAPRVQVSNLSAEQIDRLISVKGRSAPAREIEIKAETDGRVERIAAERGQQLKAGALVMRLDLRDRRARLEQSRASLLEHQTRYDAQLKLQTEGYVSETQMAETVAKLEAARAEVTRAELDLQYMELRAPFDGVIQEREVELGDFVKRGDAVASFVDNTALIVTGSIAEQEARFVKPGTAAAARLVTGQTVSGIIRYVAPVADQATRTFTVELEVANPDGSLPVGVTAEMQIPGGELQAQKISPALLTLDTDGEIGVKTIDSFNRVQFHRVDIVRSDPDGIWIAGLPANANVIVVGQGYVDVGVEVEPVFGDSEPALAEKAQ